MESNSSTLFACASHEKSVTPASMLHVQYSSESSSVFYKCRRSYFQLPSPFDTHNPHPMNRVALPRTAAILLFAVLALSAHARRNLIDVAKHRELLLSVTESWNSGAITPESKAGKPSAYHVTMNDNWTRVNPKDTTAVAQARGVYLNVEAYRAAKAVNDSRAAGFMQAVRYGVQAMEHLFMKFGRGGGVVYLVNETNMTVQDGMFDGYANVHTMFAFSHAAQIFKGAEKYRALNNAMRVYAFIHRELDDGSGGGLYARAGLPKDSIRSLDPVLHYFEALLAFWDALPQGMWLRGIVGKEVGTMGNFMVDRCAIVEPNDPTSMTLVFNYKADWTSSGIPYTRDNQWSSGEWAAVGHNPEMAWLLSRAEQRGLMPKGADWIGAGDRFIRFTEKYAMDRDGLLRYDETALDGKPLPNNPDNELYEWWPNSEAARTYIHFALTRGRTQMGMKWKPLRDLLNGPMVDPKYGGWFRFVTVKGRQREDSPKWDRWKVAYHFAMLQAEVLRLDSLP